MKYGLNLYFSLILLLAQTMSCRGKLILPNVNAHRCLHINLKGCRFVRAFKKGQENKLCKHIQPTRARALTHILHSRKHRWFALHPCSHTQCFIILNSFGRAWNGFYFFITGIHMREREQQCLTFPMVSMATENGVGISSTFNKSLFGISAQK